MDLVAKVLVYGDIHLHSRNYGSHRDYPKESLDYFRNITETAKLLGITHIIGLGDFSYGRFNTLEYRQAVEKELTEQFKLTNGNRYELKGNHDVSTKGMTEYEFYVERGLIKPSTNIQIGNANISMIDYGMHRTKSILPVEPGKTNIVCMHDFFKFNDTFIGDYGKARELDSLESWAGVDYILGGHIHNHEMFSGSIIKNGKAYKTIVHYLGCPCRPAYRIGKMQETGHYDIISIFDNGQVQLDVHEFELWKLDDSFNIEEMNSNKEIKDQKHVDISDVVKKLDSHQRVVGDPEQVILSMETVDIRYRNKAIQLLRDAQA